MVDCSIYLVKEMWRDSKENDKSTIVLLRSSHTLKWSFEHRYIYSLNTCMTWSYADELFEGQISWYNANIVSRLNFTLDLDEIWMKAGNISNSPLFYSIEMTFVFHLKHLVKIQRIYPQSLDVIYCCCFLLKLWIQQIALLSHY